MNDTSTRLLTDKHQCKPGSLKPYALINKNIEYSWVGQDPENPEGRKVLEEIWLGGRGRYTKRIMFIQTCVQPSECKTETKSGFRTVKLSPRLKHSTEWVNLSLYADMCRLDLDDCYFTSLIKALPESVGARKNPGKALTDKYLPWLMEEIKALKPKLIVCIGKPVFDVLAGVKTKESDIYGLWLYSESAKANIKFIPGMHMALKPEMIDRYLLEMNDIVKMYEARPEDLQPMPIDYKVINNSTELKELVFNLAMANKTVLSVDCEWGGRVHVDGKLRSLQIAWSDTEAAYIRFRDENAEYVFDVSYKEAGEILGAWCNRPEVKYIGHHLSADLTWMAYWLGLDWYGKGLFDTEFAMQTCDESMDLGLDIVALRYTDFGKYDWDLIQWRKKHPEKRGTGYEYVPDEILIPYGVKDVLTVYRAWPVIQKWLESQDTVKGRTLADYYREILNPFVTDVFTWFCLIGMPVDRQRLDTARELYNWVKGELELDLRKAVEAEAEEMMKDRLAKAGVPEFYDTLYEMSTNGTPWDDMVASLHKAVSKSLATGDTTWKDWEALFSHYMIAPRFNIRSAGMMRTWLFDVKKYTPVKTTSMKDQGMPSMDWEKVLAYDAAKRAKFTPAVDKASLEIFASRYDDKVLKLLLELNGVGNVCKAFLKEADVDADGNVISENGLHKWVTSDDCLHSMTGCTETGRPRSFNPNVLNYPSWLHARLKEGMKRVLTSRNERGELPDKFKPFLDISNIPTVRGMVMARPGWCVVEADYQTAEVRGLAWLSGDSEMMGQILHPDPNWAYIDDKYIPEGASKDDYVVRIAFPSYITKPDDKEKFLLTRAKNGKILETYTEDQLARDENGKPIGPRWDFHWSTAEGGLGVCREMLDKKKDRGAGKVLNFSSSYGGQPPSLKRKIEADTGESVPISVVADMLQAIYDSHLVASKWLEYLEAVPQHPEAKMVAASGRMRHVQLLDNKLTRTDENPFGMEAYEMSRGLGAIGRECRNFFLQESVGASAARACCGLLKFVMDNRDQGLKGYPFICLYDSLVVHCPNNERAIWQKALLLYMTLKVGWMYNDVWGKRVLRYPSDCELNAGWSTAPKGEFAANLNDESWEPTPDHLRPIEEDLDRQIAYYKENELASVYNTWDIDTPQEPVYYAD